MVHATKLLGSLALAASATAKEIKVDEAREAELYSSGIMHEKLMDLKMVLLSVTLGLHEMVY